MGGSAKYRFSKKIANARLNGATDAEIAELERQREEAIAREKARKAERLVGTLSLQDGNIKIKAKYQASMTKELEYDGIARRYLPKGNDTVSTEGSSLTIQVGGTTIEMTEPHSWQLREENGVMGIHGWATVNDGQKTEKKYMNIGFSNPNDMEKYQKYIEKAMKNGTPADVAKFENNKRTEAETRRLNTANEIIKKAEKEIKRNGKLYSDTEIKKINQSYRNVVYEGDTGITPEHISQEAYEWALAQVKK